jgi:hypothetical protein
MKELMYERDNDIFMSKLADELGVTIDEVEQLDYNIIPNVTNDGQTIGGFIEFKDACPIDVLRKILGNNIQDRFVELDINFFND